VIRSAAHTESMTVYVRALHAGAADFMRSCSVCRTLVHAQHTRVTLQNEASMQAPASAHTVIACALLHSLLQWARARQRQLRERTAITPDRQRDKSEGV
jgi:hypothetical protein